MSHVDVELLLLVLEGELPPGTLLRAILGHVEELCPECGEALSQLRRQAGGAAVEPTAATLHLRDHLRALSAAGDTGEGSQLSAGDAAYAGAFAGAEARARQSARRTGEEQREARRDLAALRRLPVERRADRVRGARTRFRSLALAELLLAECRRQTSEDPAAALGLADLVPLVLDRVPRPAPAGLVDALRRRALAWRASALRLLDRVEEAERSFARLRVEQARDAVDDALLHADVRLRWKLEVGGPAGAPPTVS